ncbi:hypothetical protein SAMN02927924_01370 [Sphingobium faniae]|nr:hypothetical protein SAMN02927924_01370 [Sphingobium faniae]
MMAQQPIVDRLKQSGLKPVEGALEFAGLTEAPRVTPSYFVVPEREAAQPNRMSGVIDQKVTETFSVVMIIGSARRAETVSEGLKRSADQVVDALVGWRHPEASGPCEFSGGRLVSVEGQQVIWALSFTASRHIRKESQ